jgi:lipopolysaccharide transport system permease protein
MTQTNKTVYVANIQLERGIRIWREMFKELFASRELIVRFFIRDFSAKYRQSLLGYFWALIIPFIAIGTFVFLNRTGILNIGSVDAPYPLFALIGLSVWQLFSTGIVAGTNSLVTAGSMIGKINFPRESLVFSSIAQAVFEFIIKFILIIILFVVFKVVPSWLIIFFPLAVMPIVFLTLGLSLIMSLMNGVFRDTSNIVSLGVNFLLFLTPVLYPSTDKTFIFFKLNPLSALVNAPRDLILYGHIKEPVDFIVATVVAILFFLCAWRAFHLAETKIPERI